MLKILCHLTGGHKYHDSKLRVVYNPRKGKYTFVNYCVRCGEVSSWSVPAKSIIGGVLTEEERLADQEGKV